MVTLPGVPPSGRQGPGDEPLVPWAPEELPVAADELASWSYVVLEEIVDHVALLRRWSWPKVDPLGRLVWEVSDEHAAQSVAVDARLLASQLYGPSGLLRTPRCGDTFAGRSGPAWDTRAAVSDIRSLFVGTVYDISAAARDAAKLAYVSSLAPVLPLDDADDAVVRDQVVSTARVRADLPAPALTIVAPPGRREAGRRRDGRR